MPNSTLPDPFPDDDSVDRTNPWLTHHSREIYENAWVRIIESQVTNPAGGPGIYGVVHFQNRAVGVVPIDEEGCTWLVGQYRYATDTYEWEIPEGGGAADETNLECAQRELREETGLIAADYRLLLGDLQLSNSVSNEHAYLFVATGIRQAEAMPEDTEKITVRRVPLEAAYEMVDRGEIRDAMSVMALMKLRIEGLTE